MPHGRTAMDGLPSSPGGVMWVCAICDQPGAEDLYPLCRACAEVVTPRRPRHLRLAWSRVNRVTHSKVTVEVDGA